MRLRSAVVLACVLVGGTQGQPLTGQENGPTTHCSSNTSRDCARPLAVGGSVTEIISLATGERWYRVSTGRRAVVRVVLDPMPNRWTVESAVLDAQDQQVAAHFFLAGRPGWYTAELGAGGTYYVLLRVNTGDHDADAEPFVLSLVDAGAPASPFRPTSTETACAGNETFQCAQHLPLGGRARGIISLESGERVYHVPVAQPTAVRVILDPLPATWTVHATVTDARYEEVSSYFFHRDQPGPHLVQLGAPGSYYVRLQVHDGNFDDPAEPYGIAVVPDPQANP